MERSPSELPLLFSQNCRSWRRACPWDHHVPFHRFIAPALVPEAPKKINRRLFQQPIKDTHCEGSVSATALKCQRDLPSALASISFDINLAHVLQGTTLMCIKLPEAETHPIAEICVNGPLGPASGSAADMPLFRFFFRQLELYQGRFRACR